MSSNKDKADIRKYGDESDTDVVLLVRNSEFHVHKMYLAAHSDVFKAMFYDSSRESEGNRYVIKDAHPRTFGRFMDLLYTGRIENSEHFLCYPMELTGSTTQYDNCEDPLSFPMTSFTHSVVSEKLLTSFWVISDSLIEIAVRFDMEKIMKRYIKKQICKSLCNKINCMCCLNSHIFAYHRCMDVQNTGTYSNETVIKWIKMMESGLPRNYVDVNFYTLAKFFT